MKLIDVHCHLADPCFDRDRDEVVKRALDSGVVAIVTSSQSLEEALKTAELCKRHRGVLYHSAGLDPCLLNEEAVLQVAKFIKRNRDQLVAIGEVGLDFHKVVERDRKEKQHKIFSFWISLARELDLPLVVHSRSAGKYAVEQLLAEGAERVLMHAFDGKVGYAIKAASRGFFFSIPTSVVYSQQKQKLVKHLPLESLMVETDSPVLGPKPGRNEPANLHYAVEKIAEIKGISIEKVAEITFRNATAFFEIKT